jgi:hypothetical protein
MRADYADNLALFDHLKQSRFNLINYFNENYANIIPAPSSSPSISIQSAPIAAGSPQKSFTA